MRGAAFEPGPLEGDIAAILGIEGDRPARRRRGRGARAMVPAALLIVSASALATLWLRSPDAALLGGGGVGGEAKTMVAADPVSGSSPGTPAAGVSVPHGSLPIAPPIRPRERQLAALEPIRGEVSLRQPDRRGIPRRSDDDVPAISRPLARPAGVAPDRRPEIRPAGPAGPVETRPASVSVEAAESPAGSGDALSTGRQSGASVARAARIDLAFAGEPGSAPARPAAAAPDPPDTSGPRSGSKVRVQRSIDAIRMLRRQ